MSRINWDRALADYIKDDTLSYADIAQKYGISLQAVKKRASQGKWRALRAETRLKVDQKLPEKIAESIAEVNARHAKSGRLMQNEGLRAIVSNGIKPISFQDARLSILTGIQIEREALGLTKKEIQDEIYQKFSQFTFIFNLTPDELRRFIKAALLRGGIENNDIEPILQKN